MNSAEWVRNATLDMCNAPPSEYECVLTSGATSGLRIIAEAFPWGEGGAFFYTQVSEFWVVISVVMLRFDLRLDMHRPWAHAGQP